MINRSKKYNKFILERDGTKKTHAKSIQYKKLSVIIYLNMSHFVKGKEVKIATNNLERKAKNIAELGKSHERTNLSRPIGYE